MSRPDVMHAKTDESPAPTTPGPRPSKEKPLLTVALRWGGSLVRTRDFDPSKAVHIGERHPKVPVAFVLPAEKLALGDAGTHAPLVLPGTQWGSGTASRPSAPCPGEIGPWLVVLKQATIHLERAGKSFDRESLSEQGMWEALPDIGASGPLRGPAPQTPSVDGAMRLLLAPGDTAEVTYSDLMFAVSYGVVDAEKVELPAELRPARALRRAGVAAAFALLIPAGLAAMPVMFPSDPRSADEIEVERMVQMQAYLMRAAEREQAENEAEEGELAANGDNKEGGSGVRAKGEEGSMGAAGQQAHSNRYGVKGPYDQGEDPHVAREQSLREASEFGMIGLLGSGAGGDPNAPTPWGRDDSLGQDPMSARGNAWGADIQSSFGAGGIGLSGVGRGGGGLGSVGTIGHGAGTGTGQGFGNGAGPGTGSGQGYGSGHSRLGGNHNSSGSAAGFGASLPAIVPVAAPVEEAPIDPNGRFATTYRPGGGHLAAFESALARGVFKEADREIVSDVGARYSASVDVPEGHALGMSADMERTKLSPSGGTVHLRLSLGSTATPAGERPPLSVTLVLDVSGSMVGDPIASARQAAHKLVDKLAPTDTFSLVTFSNDAKVLVPMGGVGSRRKDIHTRIDGIGTEGGTNISEGLTFGYAQAKSPVVPTDAVRAVMLLSDGRANGGITSSSALSRLALNAFQDGIQTSAFGLGSDYDGPLMSRVAADGAGGYYYLKEGSQIAPALATEIDKRLDPVATAVEVRVRLGDKVELLRVFGSGRLGAEEASRVRAQEVAADAHAERKDGIKKDRQSDTEGGMRFFMPAFARGDEHAMLLKLRMPAGVDTRRVALVELKYKDRVSKKNVTVEMPVTIGYADSDGASAATTSASVSRTIQGFMAGETLISASGRMLSGDRTGAAALLTEREALLRAVAMTLGEPGFTRDADRLSRLRSHILGDGPASEPFAVAMLLETAGHSHLR